MLANVWIQITKVGTVKSVPMKVGQVMDIVTILLIYLNVTMMVEIAVVWL